MVEVLCTRLVRLLVLVSAKSRKTTPAALETAETVLGAQCQSSVWAFS